MSRKQREESSYWTTPFQLLTSALSLSVSFFSFCCCLTLNDLTITLCWVSRISLHHGTLPIPSFCFLEILWFLSDRLWCAHSESVYVSPSVFKFFNTIVALRLLSNSTGSSLWKCCFLHHRSFLLLALFCFSCFLQRKIRESVNQGYLILFYLKAYCFVC